jgi:hypothetical protein
MYNKKLKIQILLLVTLILSNIVFGQVKKSEQELEKFMIELKSSKVDNFLILKIGCIGCDVQYIDTSKSIADGQTIYVLTQKKGQFNINIFDDLNEQKLFTIDTCSLFKFVDKNKLTLLQKEIYYKKEIPKIKSKNGFFPPGPIHYSYEELKIHSTNFNYDFKIVDKSNDYFGLNREKEAWFIVTKEIIKRINSYLQLFEK